MVGEQHGPTALEEERQPVVPRDRASDRSGRRGSTRSAAAGPSPVAEAAVGRYEPAVHGGTVVRPPTSTTSARGGRSLRTRRRGPRATVVARVVARSRTRSAASACARRSARPRCDRRATTARRAPPCRARPSRRSRRRRTSSVPKPSSLRREHDRRAVRRPRERPLTETPRRVTVLDAFLDERLRVAAVGVRDPQVEPTGLVGEDTRGAYRRARSAAAAR